MASAMAEMRAAGDMGFETTPWNPRSSIPGSDPGSASAVNARIGVAALGPWRLRIRPVSYTHLTLPTIYSV